MDEIKLIFKTRDDAVSNRDYDVFASTQIDNVSNASVSGYLSSKQLKTEVLHVVDDTQLKKVAFVKEDYGTHSAFMLYYLVNTAEGWKVYDIVSSIR